jgi:hypothetical protein
MLVFCIDFVEGARAVGNTSVIQKPHERRKKTIEIEQPEVQFDNPIAKEDPKDSYERLESPANQDGKAVTIVESPPKEDGKAVTTVEAPVPNEDDKAVTTVETPVPNEDGKAVTTVQNDIMI